MIFFINHYEVPYVLGRAGILENTNGQHQPNIINPIDVENNLDDHL